MSERCYRLADHPPQAVDVRGDEARDALIAQGYPLTSDIDCTHGTITFQADAGYVAQGEAERAAYDEFDEAERRALRRQVGAVQLASATPAPAAKWEIAQPATAE